MLGEVPTEIGLVERSDTEAEVVDIVAIGARCRPAFLSDRTGDVEQIDDDVAGSHLIETELGVALLQGAAEDSRIELDAVLDGGDPEHDVVE